MHRPIAISASRRLWTLVLYAAYGGVYIASSLAWLWVIETQRPDRWDLLGAALCLIGVGVILFGPRAARPDEKGRQDRPAELTAGYCHVN